MLPRYAEWTQKLGPRGLTVIGVHTPEMEYERDPQKLAAFVRDNRIQWRVVVDPYDEAWNRYHIGAWPTVVLIDRKGIIRDTFVGDASAPAIAAALEKLL